MDSFQVLVNKELTAAHRIVVAIASRLACTETAWRSSCGKFPTPLQNGGKMSMKWWKIDHSICGNMWKFVKPVSSRACTFRMVCPNPQCNSSGKEAPEVV